MHRLLILALVLPLVGGVDAGHARDKQRNLEIVAIDVSGRQTNLTQNLADDLAPTVARDGRIAFLSTRDGQPDLYVMDSNGGNVRRLTKNAGVAWGEDLEASQASWSPSGDTIAFDGEYCCLPPPGCLQHCGNWDVLVIGSDGSGLEQLALRARAPAWSPDGRRLAYESGIDAFDYDDAGSVTIARLDSSRSVQVKAYNQYSRVGPVWSPSGNELAFEAQRADGSPPTSIYVIGPDGTRKRRLAAGQNPTWSPDGRRLAFIWNSRLVTIGLDGKGRRRLSPKGEFVVSAAWSPKGGTIAYIAGTKADPYAYLPKNLRLETVSADRKHVHVLAREPGWFADAGAPVWTADGKRILMTVQTPR